MKYLKAKKSLKFLLLLGLILYGLFQTQDVKAATSYTNAKQFYESTSDDDYVETYKGSIYVGTKAKQASSSSNLKYYTLGYDVTLSAGPYSLTFTVKRNTSDSPTGSMIDVNKVIEGGYVYNLYKISMESIRSLARAKNTAVANAIFSYDSIKVVMDSVMTTKQGNTYHGSISENGWGGANVSGTVYWFINDSHIQAMKNIFVGHNFIGYFDIEARISNYPIIIAYNINGGTVNKAGYSTVSDVLYYNGSRYTYTYHLYDLIDLWNYSSLNIEKTGYHTDAGKEWIYKYRNLVLSQNTLYTSQYIEPDIGTASRSIGITVTANWVPNTYTVKYNANGGEGSVASQTFTYDKSYSLRSNTFTRTGYRLKDGAEWNTKADGSGKSYSSKEVVKNLTATHKGTVTLYANWEPLTFTITTNPGEGSGGTEKFYEVYDHYYYETKDPVTHITIPERIGYDFLGYYTNKNAQGTKIVDETGQIVVSNTFFTEDSEIFAYWEKHKYTVTFDKQGGREDIGTNTALVCYGDQYPLASKPYKEGYTFKGYYKDLSYETMLYNEYMSPLAIYKTYADTTVYAKWGDEAPPTTDITSETEEWTNQADGVVVKATAYDKVSGLDYVELYRNNTLIDKKTSLNGTKDVVTFELTHTLESAYRYRIVACDMEGDISESYTTVKYDITAPWGKGSTEPNYQYTLNNDELTSFSISIKAFDYKEPLEAGLYDADDNKIVSWAELLYTYSFDIEADYKTYDSRGTLHEIIKTYGLQKGTKLILDDSVTRIGKNAINGCSNLKEVVVSAGVKDIAKEAFGRNPNLKKISVAGDNSVYDSRNNCNAIIETATNTMIVGCVGTKIPNTVQHIGSYAFYNAWGLKNIKIPNFIKSVGSYAFAECIDLQEFTLAENITLDDTQFIGAGTNVSGYNGYWYDIATTIKYKDTDIPTNVAATYVSLRPAGLYDNEGDILVLWNELIEIYGLKIDSDFDEFFDKGTLYEVIKTNDFKEATQLVIGYNVTRIGKNAISQCQGITEVVVGAGITEIHYSAITQNDNFVKLSVSDDNPIFDSRDNCNAVVETDTNTLVLGSGGTIIPESIENIKDNAFFYCTSLKNIVIPENVTSIGGSVFENCTNLYSFTLPGHIELNGTQFKNAGTNVKHYNGYWYNKETAEKYEDVAIPSNKAVTYVAVRLAGIYDIEGNILVLWNSMIEDYGVDLSKDYEPGENPLVSILETLGEETYALVLSDSITRIGNYTCTGGSVSEVIIPDGIETIGDHAFEYCMNLEYLTIPDSVVTIGDYAFYVTSVCDLNLGNGVKTIGNSAFEYCMNLEYLTIPDSVEIIGNGAFYYCYQLTNVYLGNGAVTIGGVAFSECTSLTTVTLGNNIKTIGSDAFRNCSSLTEIVIPDSVTTLGASAFYGCKNLVTAQIGEGVTVIPAEAFYDCRSLLNVSWSDNVTTIENSAFVGCVSLEEVTFSQNLTFIDCEAFWGCTNLKRVYFKHLVNNISFEEKAFYKNSGEICTFYFRNQEIANSIKASMQDGYHYNSKYTIFSTDYTWYKEE